jgi:hypothetical protein
LAKQSLCRRAALSATDEGPICPASVRGRPNALRVRDGHESGTFLRPLRRRRAAQRSGRGSSRPDRDSHDERLGKISFERKLIRAHIRAVEPLLQATCTHEIDATLPLDEVVDRLVEIGTAS